MQCQTGEVRIVGMGDPATEGLVQVCYEGIWGTVCDEMWDAVDASIVCKELGFSRFRKIFLNKIFQCKSYHNIMLPNY